MNMIFSNCFTESYAFGTRGSGECLQGNLIMEQNLCKAACTALNIPQTDKIHSGNKCYMNDQGKCLQDGVHSATAMMICNIDENNCGKYITKI